MSQFVLGADIGGTHITAALVDIESRTILNETITRQPVDAAGAVQEVIASWSNALYGARSKYGHEISHLGIAMPGPFDYENGVSLMQNQGKYDALYGVNVKQLLADALQVEFANIRMLNDAPCFLQGEVFAGAAQGYERAIGLTLGTGLGSAVYTSGTAHDADLWDTSFKDSIAEAYLSSRWFVQRFYELTGIKSSNVKSIVELYGKQPKVQTLFDEFAENLATFLTSFVQQEQPEVIILGGNISKTFPLFKGKLLESLRLQGINFPVKTAQLGEEAALLGAASLWQPVSKV